MRMVSSAHVCYSNFLQLIARVGASLDPLRYGGHIMKNIDVAFHYSTEHETILAIRMRINLGINV